MLIWINHYNFYNIWPYELVVQKVIAELCLVSTLIPSPSQLLQLLLIFHKSWCSVGLWRWQVIEAICQIQWWRELPTSPLLSPTSFGSLQLPKYYCWAKRTIRDGVALPYILLELLILLALLTLTSLLTKWHICLHIMPYDRLWELNGVRVGMGRTTYNY